jgi:hypothetical protein
MIKNITISKRMLNWISTLAIITVSPLGYAQGPVTVKALAVHYAGNIQYSYQVSNQTRARSIVSVSIGNRGVQPADPVYATNAQPELLIYPTGSYWGLPIAFGDNRGETPRLGGTYTSPPGWTGGILEYQESGNFSVDWHLDDSNTKTYPVIQPGQTLNFGVAVPTHDDPRSVYTMSDPAYLSGHFTVGFDYNEVTDEDPAFWKYTGSIVPIDTTPPSLTVSLSPSTLWPPNDKLVSVTAVITVTDDYDPSPEIKLESITANEPLEAEDIQDASFGTDDRNFKLRAERKGKEDDHKQTDRGTKQLGRIYTVTYSATDASGNKSTASATVTVPHDQEEKEKAEDKNKGKQDR